MLLFIILLLFVGIAAGLAWFLIGRDRGEQEPVGALWLAAAFGFFGAFPAVFLESFLPLDPEKQVASTGILFVTMMGVGVIEEACKFIPLASYIYKKRYFNEHTDGVLYFALAGLGFGLPENILYASMYGTKAGVARIILTPIFHAATTGLVGYYFARRKLTGKAAIGIVGPLLAVMLLHGMYDFGLASEHSLLSLLSVLITFVLSCSLFIFYTQANRADQESGLSTVGHNNFCRSCGTPNPMHHLYCTHCGKYA